LIENVHSQNDIFTQENPLSHQPSVPTSAKFSKLAKTPLNKSKLRETQEYVNSLKKNGGKKNKTKKQRKN
jgi:hypothetical protein